MNIVLFLGTKIGYIGLITLIQQGAKIDHVFVDREREHEIEKLSTSIVNICERYSIPVSVQAKMSEVCQIIRKLEIDFMFCFGFRRLLDDEVLGNVRQSAFSTHFSLLPKYRGFAPVNWAIINGEKECGVSLSIWKTKLTAGI